MKNTTLTLTTLALAAGTLLAGAGAAHAANDLNNIDVYYHGGALIQNVQVSTLFWGKEWQGTNAPAYVSGFFTALFDDGRFMGNLAQYSAGGYTIGNGTLAGGDLDPADLGGQVTEEDIEAEIRSEIAAGKLPPATPDSLYVVYTPPDVVVVDDQGADSVHTFAGFHGYDTQGQFAFALISETNDANAATATTSHELAEAVTDPQVNAGTLGWYDDNNGEIGDIPQDLAAANLIDQSSLYDVLTGPDGTQYEVQKEWSNQDGGPNAFAASAN